MGFLWGFVACSLIDSLEGSCYSIRWYAKRKDTDGGRVERALSCVGGSAKCQNPFLR